MAPSYIDDNNHIFKRGKRKGRAQTQGSITDPKQPSYHRPVIPVIPHRFWEYRSDRSQEVPELPKPEMHIVDMSKAEA